MSATTDCSGSSNNDTNDSSQEEVIVPVPAELANGVPLGFSFDAGGSVTKLLYRSKLDYKDGKPIGESDVLRLRFYPSSKRRELVQFLKENCDVRITSSSISDEKHELYLTGIWTQHIRDELEKAFNCRVRVASEMDLVADGITQVANRVPLLKQQLPFSLEAVKEGLACAREFLVSVQQQKEANINAYGEEKPPAEGFDVVSYVTKLMTIDDKTLADELSAEPLTFPCLLVQCGSCTNASILYEDGKLGVGSYNPLAAKTFLSLGRVLTGAKNAEELIEMAAKGDYRKVDQTAGDLKVRDGNCADWYSLMSDSLLVFCLGKLSEEENDGQYSKEDIAAGLLHMICQNLVINSLLLGDLHKTKSILFNGSFVQWPAARKLLQKCFITWSLMSPLLWQFSPTMHVLPNSGFFPALGAWYRNVEVQKTEETADSVK